MLFLNNWLISTRLLVWASGRSAPSSRVVRKRFFYWYFLDQTLNLPMLISHFSSSKLILQLNEIYPCRGDPGKGGVVYSGELLDMPDTQDIPPVIQSIHILWSTLKYITLHMQSAVSERTNMCLALGMLPFHPSWMFTLTAVQHFFLIFNSSVNFIIYCCMGTKYIIILITKLVSQSIVL